jgi:hypothetical protein
LLLEVENIHRLHDRSYIRWMDSCTSPDESPLNDLWSERRVIESILIATGRRPGDLLVSVEPLLRWVRRVLTTTSMARSA